jgi:hypothetical protein
MKLTIYYDPEEYIISIFRAELFNTENEGSMFPINNGIFPQEHMSPLPTVPQQQPLLPSQSFPVQHTKIHP